MRYPMQNRVKAGVIPLALVLFVAATAAKAARMEMPLTPDSKVWVEGTSTVRDYKCIAGELESEVVPTAAETAPLPLAELVESANVAVAVDRLDCGNGKMNDHMRKALDSDDNPRIVFALDSYRIVDSDITLVGTLSIAGRENPVEIAGTITEADGTVRVQASHTINMTEWGIKPPSLMFGTMKVHDPVTIQIDVGVRR